MVTLLELSRIDAGYPKKVILSGVGLAVQPGEITVLIGPNGAGKSTLLKTAAGQLAPLGGTVLIKGQELGSYTSGETAKMEAVMLTERPPQEQMTCYEVVSLGRYPYTGRLGILSEDDHRIVRETMELVRTTELADRDYHEISDGQRQRLLLARAIAQEPEIMILDEPTSYLDIRHKLEFIDILKDLVRERHIGVLMSMHELELAYEVSDNVVCIGSDGSIVMTGKKEDVFTEKMITSLYEMEEGRLGRLYGRWLRG